MKNFSKKILEVKGFESIKQYVLHRPDLEKSINVANYILESISSILNHNTELILTNYNAIIIDDNGNFCNVKNYYTFSYEINEEDYKLILQNFINTLIKSKKDLELIKYKNKIHVKWKDEKFNEIKLLLDYNIVSIIINEPEEFMHM